MNLLKKTTALTISAKYIKHIFLRNNNSPLVWRDIDYFYSSAETPSSFNSRQSRQRNLDETNGDVSLKSLETVRLLRANEDKCIRSDSGTKKRETEVVGTSLYSTNH